MVTDLVVHITHALLTYLQVLDADSIYMYDYINIYVVQDFSSSPSFSNGASFLASSSAGLMPFLTRAASTHVV